MIRRPRPTKEQLQRYADDDYTAAQIAKLHPPMTRSAVLALCMRRGVRLGERRKAAVKVNSRLNPPPKQPEPQPEPRAHRNGGGCRWIDGDVRKQGWRYCGKPTTGPLDPWCPEHRKRVYVKPSERPLNADRREHITPSGAAPLRARFASK